MPPFPQAEAEAAVAASFGRPVSCGLCEFRSAGRRRLDRAGASGDGRDRGGAARRRGQSACGPASSGASTPISPPSPSPRSTPRNLSAEARRLRVVEVVDTLRRSVMVEMDFRLEAAALSEMAENTKADPDFRVPAIDWDRTTKEVLTLEWIDATPLSDRARLQAKGFDLPATRPRLDPDLSAPRAARRLLSRRHASRQSVRRR